MKAYSTIPLYVFTIVLCEAQIPIGELQANFQREVDRMEKKYEETILTLTKVISTNKLEVDRVRQELTDERQAKTREIMKLNVELIAASEEIGDFRHRLKTWKLNMNRQPTKKIKGRLMVQKRFGLMYSL